jgi:porin
MLKPVQKLFNTKARILPCSDRLARGIFFLTGFFSLLSGSAQVVDSASIKALFTPEELRMAQQYQSGQSSDQDSVQPEQIDKAPAQVLAPIQSDSTTGPKQWFVIGGEANLEYAYCAVGGMQQKGGFTSFTDLYFTISSDSLGWYRGGTFRAEAQNTAGENTSFYLTGDYQTFSNIANGNFTYLYQLWYEQQFGKSALLIGKHDANSEFFISDYGLMFLNSAFGVPSNMSLSVPLSIFPRNGLAARLNVQPNDNWLFKAAVYDGAFGSYDTDPYSIETKLDKEEGAFIIAETQAYKSLIPGLTGTYRLGGFYHTADYTHLDDTTETQTGKNWGAYLIIDQELFREKGNPENGLGAFLQVSYMPADYNMNNFYFGFGLNYTGLIPNRPNDILGLGYAHAAISKIFRSVNTEADAFEGAIEFTYKCFLNEHFVLQPCVQYLLNPGLDPSLSDALVPMFRFKLIL